MTENYLKFDNQFVGDVIDGNKKITIRKGEPYVEIGEEVELLTGCGNKFGEAMIMWVAEDPAKDVVNREFEHHENYSGFMEFKEQMNEYYDEPIESSTTFSVIAFNIYNE